jgi:5-hydroxyisourate hydrolase
MSGLTTHALDLVTGGPAVGMTIELWRRDGGSERLLKTLATNADGRTDEPLLSAAEMRAGRYTLVFHLGAYFGGASFFDEAPVRFVIARPDEHYHVPILAAPFGYSTYRGS